MADRAEKLLVPIREKCQNLISSKRKNNLSEELITTAASAGFYSCNIFSILLDLLAKDDSIGKSKLEEVFDVLTTIFEKQSKQRKNLLQYIYACSYNSSKSNEKSPLLEHLFKFAKLTDVPDEDTAKHYLNLTIFWTSQKSFIADHVNVIYSNLRFLMRSCMPDEKIQDQFLSNLIAATIRFQDRVDDFLTSVVYRGLKECPTEGKISGDKSFMEYIDMIHLAIFLNADLQLCGKIIKTVDKFLTEKEHVALNNILSKCVDVFSREKITAESLSELYKGDFKNITSSQDQVAKNNVVNLVATLFNKTYKKFEQTEQCYKSSHDFVFQLFNMLKYIKNAKTVIYQCCEDIKRHAIYTLVKSMARFGYELIVTDHFTKQVQKLLQYYLDYGLLIYKQINCPKKSYIFNDLNMVLSSATNTLCRNVISLSFSMQVYKALVNLEQTKGEQMDIKALAVYGILLTDFTSENKDGNSEVYADTLIFPLLFGLKVKSEINPNLLIKLVNALREAIKPLKYESVFQYVLKKAENSEFAKYSKDIDFEELKIMEMEAVKRYQMDKVDDITKLFSSISVSDINMNHLPRMCLALTEKNIAEIDLRKIKDLNERLEKYYNKNNSCCDIKFPIALASNYYYIGFAEWEKLEKTINASSKDLFTDVPKCLNLDTELRIVECYDRFLEYSMDILFRIKSDPSEIESIPSVRLFISFIENVSTQYFVRGIANKDLEMKLILWHLLQHFDNHVENILDTASFFLDNTSRLIGSSGHYICISKKLNYIRMEEVIPKANEALEKLLENVEEKSEAKQARALNYMISLWAYYMVINRQADARNIWEKFTTTSKVCKLPTPLYNCIINAKKYVALSEIHYKCAKKNFVDLNYNAIVLLQQIRTFYTDFSNNFQFLFRTLVLKVINFSLNRMEDIEYFTKSMLTLKNQAIKKGLFVKTLELYSLSVLRNLNMEKLDDAKADLKTMSKMLQLNEEILVETPIAAKPVVHVPNYPSQDLMVRKAIPDSNHSRKSRIEIFNDSRNENNELVEQLQTFIHQPTCKCSMCKYPVLKFIHFQMGCHYSRLFFMIAKYDISKEFNEYAIEPWRHSCMKVLRSKECLSFGINKQDFVQFSIRWLFQVADTIIKRGDYSELDDIYTEVELLCTSNIEDYDCIKQHLHARMMNMEFLQNQKEIASAPKELDFNEFLRMRGQKPETTKKATSKTDLTKEATRKEISQATRLKIVPKSASQAIGAQKSKQNLQESVIYVDSDDGEAEKTKPKKAAPAKVPAPKTSRSTRANNKPAETDGTPRIRLKRCL